MGLPFGGMGIISQPRSSTASPNGNRVFRQRLREWGLDSSEPIGTLILAGSPEELARMIRAHPASDFLLPQQYRAAVEAAAGQTHALVEAGEDHFFLLSRETRLRAAPPAWSCCL